MKCNMLKPTYAKNTPRGVEIDVELSIIRIKSNKPMLEKYASEYVWNVVFISNPNPDDETIGFG